MGSYRAIGEFPWSKVPARSGAKGFASFFVVCEHMETHESVYEASKSTVNVEK